MNAHEKAAAKLLEIQEALDHTVTPEEVAKDKVVSVFADYPGNVYCAMQSGRLFLRGGTPMSPGWKPIAGPVSGSRLRSISISSAGVMYAVTEDGKIWERKPNPKVYETAYQFAWFEIAGPVD